MHAQQKQSNPLLYNTLAKSNLCIHLEIFTSFVPSYRLIIASRFQEYFRIYQLQRSCVIPPFSTLHTLFVHRKENITNF